MKEAAKEMGQLPLLLLERHRHRPRQRQRPSKNTKSTASEDSFAVAHPVTAIGGFEMSSSVDQLQKKLRKTRHNCGTITR